MGYAHLIWVHEDAITEVEGRPDAAPKYAEAIGTAVLKLCLNPDQKVTADGVKPIRSAAIMNHWNAVNLATTVHSTDHKIIVWAGNCARTLDELDDDELERAWRVLEATYQHRKNNKTPIE